MALPQEKRYTFADVLAGDESERVELVCGDVYMMSPPTRKHQKIIMTLSAQLFDFLRDKPCEVYPAPFGVRLFEENGDRPEDVDTMVEPDISVICDPGKLDEHGCKGAPDFIAEVLSPSTQGRDRVLKFNLYERAGVREYWIIDPDSRTIHALTLEDGSYHAGQIYTAGMPAPVSVLGGFAVDTAALFA